MNATDFQSALDALVKAAFPDACVVLEQAGRSAPVFILQGAASPGGEGRGRSRPEITRFAADELASLEDFEQKVASLPSRALAMLSAPVTEAAPESVHTRRSAKG